MHQFNLLLLPNKVLIVVQLIQSVGFVYADQTEFISSEALNDLAELLYGERLNDQTIVGDWCVETHPGIRIQHIPSGHWWFHPNDEFPAETAKALISLDS